MKRILLLTGKDIRQLMRDRSTVFWALGFPFVIAVLFGSIYGGNNGGPQRLGLVVVDQDCSEYSKGLISRLRKSDALEVSTDNLDAAKDSVRHGKKAAFLVLPKGWGAAERGFQMGKVPLKMGVDPGKKAMAGMIEGVVTQATYARMEELFGDSKTMKASAKDAIEGVRKDSSMQPGEKASLERFLNELTIYSDSPAAKTSNGVGLDKPVIEQEPVAFDPGSNPANSYEVTFPQAMLWALISIVSQFAIALVRERQQGTLVRLKSSPMSAFEILAGQGLACFLSCAVVMAGLLVFGVLAFHIRLGSPMLAVAAISSTALSAVGLMVFLSSLSKTTQAASGSVWGLMMLLAIFGGAMIPSFMMPSWMKGLSVLSPLYWGITAMEGAIWRGFSATEMLLPVGVLLGVGLIAFAGGVRILRTREV